MRSHAPRAAFFCVIKVGCLFWLLAVCSNSAAGFTDYPNKLLCRPEMGQPLRENLARSLREITGWSGLHFDASGALATGNVQNGGSQSARALLAAASSGKNLILFEDASRRSDVVFSRVIEGKWTKGAENKPPVYVVLIDYTDFSYIWGDADAVAAFNVGWGVLHEVAHIVHDLQDADGADNPGACESLINGMRRELGLAERTNYYFTLFPGLGRSEFKTKFVRLSFESQGPSTKKKRQLWLMWDANLVGEVREPYKSLAESKPKLK